MAGVTNREFWDFRVKTRAQFTKLAEQIANIDTSGGGGISELTSKMVVDALGYTPYNANNPANYITSDALSPYAKTADVSITYATIASIQGFENRIGGLEGAVPQLNERVTTVEGKVSSLNETVSTGKNNLLDRVNVIEEEYATKTYVDNAIDGYFTKTNIKNTLGISDWALAATKPSYTSAEVGALAQDSSGANADLDTILDSKTAVLKPFFQVLTNNNVGSARKGVLRMSYNGSESQLLFDHYNRLLRYRTIGEKPRDWATIAFASDIPTKLSQLTDDVVAGKYLPLSGGTLNGSIIATSFIGNLTGNADSATQLATPRKLWGQRFDGTGDVSGDITANKFIGYLRGDIIYDNGVDEGHFIGLGSSGVGVKGLLNYVYGNFPILFYTNGFERMRIGEYVGIGTTSPTERLDVSGNIKASGNINATSITINGVTITASNGSITVNGNVLATGAITAKKVG